MVSTQEMLAQVGGLAAVAGVLCAVRVWHWWLERKVYRLAAAPVPGRTRDLPQARAL